MASAETPMAPEIAGPPDLPTATATPVLPAPALPTQWSLADLQKHLGGVPPERIRLYPPPGYATEDDVIRIEEREGRFYELEDGILVEKGMGWHESGFATVLIIEIGIYLRTHDLGKLLGPDGSLKILPRMVKIPDVSFISWSRFPKEKLPRRPIPALVPDLVVEILSESNTRREMDKKLKRYFEAGVRLVWYIDPETRTARAYTSLKDMTEIDENGALDGGDVLPGFRLPLRELFAQAERQGPAA
jgi:Uma2 family endonuclease